MVKDPLGFFFLRTNIFLKINIPIGTQNSGYNPSKTLVLLHLYFLKNKVRKTGEISVGPDGAEVKTKSGTEVKVGDKGATVGSKDVKIDIKKKDEKQ